MAFGDGRKWVNRNMTDNNTLFYVLFLQIRADSPLQSKEPKQTSARMHTHTYPQH